MAGSEDTSIETLANCAIAAGCLQAVMSMVHPELVKFVSFQKERVARSDAALKHTSSRDFKQRRERADNSNNLDSEQQNDLSFQLKYLRQHWHSHLRYYGLDPDLPSIVQRALMFRNKVSHQNQLTLSQYETAIATFEKLADMIDCNALIRHQIRALVTKLLSFSSFDKKDNAEIPLKSQKHDNKSELEATQMMPMPASLDQILQHHYLYDGDEDEDPLWVELKLIGDDYFNERNYTEAIEAYSQGLDVAPQEAVLYGNRSMCYLRLKEFECAREDAKDALDADNYQDIKYYRLLSEAMIGTKDYDEAKGICDEGLELDPNDMTLLSRKRLAEAMIADEKAEYEKEKKRLELEARAKVQAATAVSTTKHDHVQSKTGRKKKTNKKKKKHKNATPELELVPMIKYQEVPTTWIETHSHGSRRLELYQQGIRSLVVAAKALLQVTDSIGTPDRSKLPLDQLVKEGMTNLRKAGEAGVAEAWFRLGILYSINVRKGMPLIADPHKMMECFHKAAELRPFIKPPGNRVFPHQGVAEAENELGVCYQNGIPALIANADLKKAFHYFLRSAEHDFPLGQYHVAIAYATGSGTPVDAFAARMWTSRAAQHGLPEAQRYLAQLLEKGLGGKRDELQAREWSRVASQAQLTDLLMTRDTAHDVMTNGSGKVANQVSSIPTSVQRGRKMFQEFYDAYLGNGSRGDGAELRVDDDSNGNERKASERSSYTPRATSLADRMNKVDIYRPRSAGIDADIRTRAQAGSIMACKYLESEKLLEKAAILLATGDIKGALRDLKKADTIWERPKCLFTTTSYRHLLPVFLKEAAVSYQINPRDVEAAYVLGRWERMNDQDAVSHWKRCVKSHPNEASFHFYLGVAYLMLQRYNDAMNAMEMALKLEKKPDWLYWVAAPMIGLGMIESALSTYLDYVKTNPPDERYIPDAYYSIGALYFKQSNHAMATVYHELGQMAESVAFRFPAFYPVVLYDTPKETLRSNMKKNGYMEASVIARIMAQNMVDCGFCKARIKPGQLLSHKLGKCPRRVVACQDCSECMVFDSFQSHRQFHHVASGKDAGDSTGKRRKDLQATDVETSTQPIESTLRKLKGNSQELTTPKFHFVGTIVKIAKAKRDPTVFTLKTMTGHHWTLRIDHMALSLNAVVAISQALDGAHVNNLLLVFWRHAPPLEMMDRRAIAVPMADNVYGQDMVIYVLQCSAQVLDQELYRLRHNKHVERGLLCTGCGKPPLPGSNLLTCGSCMMIRYCSRDCQRIHWKQIHRYMCKETALLRYCTTKSEDVTLDERALKMM